MTSSKKRGVRCSDLPKARFLRLGVPFFSLLFIVAVVFSVSKVRNRSDRGLALQREAGASASAEQVAVPQAPAPLAATAAQRIYLNENGERIAPPPGTFAPAKPLRDEKRAEPVVRRSAAPGGGEFTRLDNRFMVHSVAVIGGDGKLRVDCVRDPKAPGHASGCDHGETGENSDQGGVR